MHTFSTLRFSTMDVCLLKPIPAECGDALRTALPLTELDDRDCPTLLRGLRLSLLSPLMGAPVASTCPGESHHKHIDEPLQDGPEDSYWYCPECGDGPYQSWNPCCANCAYKRG
ncbi:hypothetical protein BU26DRAFT_503906 [Trematosphaeria pertusa]|uniref:Uncharacterized protein n=1 Tax=Trematosphaeria pertusa TaxID=390896 RepID=A0A6A6IL90_9PLEO|nr:uncharacterized protein BU26DRAFT_503906 [Trematosphaeria pertusa]KAF2251385.1 hypothetical protein BU26DRAFT_503906 [Trematosphaeria pertusa]